MSHSVIWPALLRELRQAPGPNRKLKKAVRYHLHHWEADGDPRWIDLAVIAVTEAGLALPPTLQKLVQRTALLRAHRRDPDFDGPDCDGYMIYLAERALFQEKPARGPIDAVWRAIADNSLGEVDAAEWARIISQRVVAQVIEYNGPTKGRADAAIAALGLRGQADATYVPRLALETWMDFGALATPTSPRKSWVAKRYEAMRAFYPGLKPRDAKKRIANLEKSLKKSR